MDLTWLSPIFLLLAVVGCVYGLTSAWLGGRFAAKPAPRLPEGAARPSVTILKPLCGLEPNLYQNLETFCRQDYPAPYRSSSACRTRQIRRSAWSSGCARPIRTCASTS